MDLVPSVKEKLNYFRIKELKEVLNQLQLSKQGKKQVTHMPLNLSPSSFFLLTKQLVALFPVSKMWAKNNAGGKEQVAKLVDDTYRKMQISGATDLASKGQGASDSSSVNLFSSILTCCYSNQLSTTQPHSNKAKMFSFGRNCCFKYPSTYFRRRNASNNTNALLSTNSFCHPFGKNSHTTCFFHHAHKLDPFLFQISTSYTQFPIPFAPFNSHYSTKAPSRSYQRRAQKRLLKSSKPTLNQAQFQLALSQIPPRFTPEELCNVIAGQNDPLVCLELFHWASQQPRFRHDVSTFHVTIKKLGAAKMYQEMDDIVNQLLAVPLIGSEALFNMVIYYFTQARKLTRAVNVFKHMKSRRNLKCCFRPSIRTYNILFAAFLGRGSNSYINHVYMETIRCLFRQMVSDGIKPDIFSLNSMIKGYVLSLHVNNALRIFHQMGVVYDCPPNALTYDCLIHGLCAQGRTNNAKELYYEMKTKGFVPSSKSYNSLVNSLALGGEIEEAVNYLWEMTDKQRSADFITYKTVLDEICRRGTVQEAVRFLRELQEKDLADGHAYRKLLYVLEDDYGNSVSRTVGTQ